MLSSPKSRSWVALTILAFVFDVVTSDAFSCFGNLTIGRKWPPTDPNAIKNDQTGEYDMRINPYLADTAKYRNSLCKYVQAFKKKYRKSTKGTCFFQAAYILYKVKRSPHDYYPQPVNHVKVLKTVRSGKPVYEAPMNDLPLSILKRPKTCESKHDFVLFIYTAPEWFGLRRKYRTKYLNPKLWRKIKLGYVFVMGLPARNAVQTFYFDGMRLYNVRNYRKGLDRDTVTAQMLIEEAKYRDMLIGDHDNNAYSQTWSYILAIRWASVFCNKKVPMFGFINGEFVLIPAKFSDWLKRFPKNKKARLFAGHSFKNVKVNHNTKNRRGFSWQEMAWSRYIPYIHEKLILFGHDTMQEAAILSAWVKYFRFLSVYVAIVNRKLRIKPQNIKGIFTRLGSRSNARKAILGDMRSADRLINWGTGKAK